MKKIITVILAVCIVFSGVCVFAESTEGYEKALALVKERIGSTDKFSEFDGHSSSYEEGRYYSFDWSDEDEGYLGVTVSEDGVITEYYREEKDAAYATISQRLTRDAAKTRAAELFGELNPDCSIEITECYPENDGFSIGFVRTENGIPVENSGNMQIDAKGESISYMYYYYDPAAEFETGEVITYDAAVSAFNEKLGFELKYVSYYEDSDIRIKPVYAVKDKYDTYISALTGEVITVCRNNSSNDKFFMANGYAAEESATNDFSIAEQAELSEIAMTISEDEAIEIIRKHKILAVPEKSFEDYTVSTYGVDDETRGYSFVFRWDENNSARVRINGNTGEILYFSKNSHDDKKAVFSNEDAEKTALNALSVLAGEKASEYHLVKNDYKAAVPYDNKESVFADFSFVRYVNGIPFYEDSADITVSLAENLLTHYNISYSDADFPLLENLVDYETASGIYIENAEFETVYVKDEKIYRLVYALSDYYNEVDAFTGEYSGEEEQLMYADVSGHYCEKIVGDLLEYGIGFEGTELKPDEPVLQKEFAALIRRCVSYGGRLIVGDDYNFEDLYKYQLDDIIEDKNERNPDGNVTRLDAAKYMAYAMGYGKIGAADIFRPMFSDTKEAGYASILCGLKIMNGDGNGNFNPDGILTRAQALIMIYNYLNI